MLPVANLHLKDLYDSTVEFFSQHSPSIQNAFRALGTTGTDELLDSDVNSDIHTPIPYLDPTSRTRSSRESTFLRERPSFDNTSRGRRRCDSTCSCPSCSPLAPSSLGSDTSPHSMRKNSREYDTTKSELIRSQGDVMRLEERCRGLERTLRETKEMVRARDVEIDRLRRDKERPPIPSRRNTDPRLEHVTSDPQISARVSQSSSRRSPDSHRSDKVQAIANGAHYMPSAAQNASGKSSGSGSGSGSGSSSESDSEEERAHLRGLDTFLTKVDRFSGAQIIQALQDLNSEILQFAASATELCTFDKYSRASPSRTTQATKETASRLGPSLARFLSSRDHAQDPILVQLALQACIATCIARALSSFCFGFASKPNAVLTQIYQQMYSTEVQSTSSRWRALTHRHIQELHPRLEEFAVNDLVETIFRWSSDIFIISGCSNPQKASCSIEGLRARFGTQVRRISNAVFKLAKITREEIMSTNFDVVAVENGQVFEKREMTDAFEDYGTSSGAVLCTTDLGLSCATRKSGGGMGHEGFVERRLLLRPKVVLESVADVLDPR